MVRNATKEDIAFVIANMRPEDSKEIQEISGKSVEEAIADLDSAPYVALVIWRDEPVAIFGATLRPDGKSAQTFKFATDSWPIVVREAIKFIRRQFIDAMRDMGVETIYVTTLKTSDMAWLKLFGVKELPEGEKFKNFRLDLTAEAA